GRRSADRTGSTATIPRALRRGPRPRRSRSARPAGSLPRPHASPESPYTEVPKIFASRDAPTAARRGNVPARRGLHKGSPVGIRLAHSARRSSTRRKLDAADAGPAVHRRGPPDVRAVSLALGDSGSHARRGCREQLDERVDGLRVPGRSLPRGPGPADLHQSALKPRRPGGRPALRASGPRIPYDFTPRLASASFAFCSDSACLPAACSACASAAACLALAAVASKRWAVASLICLTSFGHWNASAGLDSTSAVRATRAIRARRYMATSLFDRVCAAGRPEYTAFPHRGGPSSGHRDEDPALLHADRIARDPHGRVVGVGPGRDVPAPAMPGTDHDPALGVALAE